MSKLIYSKKTYKFFFLFFFNCCLDKVNVFYDRFFFTSTSRVNFFLKNRNRKKNRPYNANYMFYIFLLCNIIVRCKHQRKVTILFKEMTSLETFEYNDFFFKLLNEIVSFRKVALSFTGISLKTNLFFPFFNFYMWEPLIIFAKKFKNRFFKSLFSLTLNSKKILYFFANFLFGYPSNFNLI